MELFLLARLKQLSANVNDFSHPSSIISLSLNSPVWRRYNMSRKSFTRKEAEIW